jgi:hypothetical protein
MAFTTTSNFSGKAAGFYISAALKEAKSLEYLTMIENIKKNLQVNLDLCKSNIIGFLGSVTNESWCWCASSCFF